MFNSSRKIKNTFLQVSEPGVLKMISWRRGLDTMKRWQDTEPQRIQDIPFSITWCFCQDSDRKCWRTLKLIRSWKQLLSKWLLSMIGSSGRWKQIRIISISCFQLLPDTAPAGSLNWLRPGRKRSCLRNIQRKSNNTFGVVNFGLKDSTSAPFRIAPLRVKSENTSKTKEKN